MQNGLVAQKSGTLRIEHCKLKIFNLQFPMAAQAEFGGKA
jgi:hypothetical protein